VHGGARWHRFRVELAALAARQRLPATYPASAWVEVGGLMSCGPDGFDLFQRAMKHVDRILKGANPAEPPVEQPTRIDLTINLKAASALGITVPRSLLPRANRPID
jgi:putative ABC transport system substrate-binding protein